MGIILINDIYDQYFAALPTAQSERPIRSISGVVTVLSKGLSCKVSLHDRKTRNVLRSTISNIDGSYSFTSLPLGKFFVMALHPVLNYNAVIQDNVVPK
ncbi:carboxypeptidase regulatory-like domain-containing protein [Acinetobacter pseudolwoffii]|uniref:carboxypeptidase regulatory-like domain-containing protein n=1 Tax=Acinetobacter pseudolwoffii TaxID=2053287 RepID=UPI000B111867|nr:carboxypeptidase regulatory-like domain-containing protein [Acinetobacter pseudolwoffii]